MSNINPFTGSILATPQAQRLQAVDKDRQVRKATDRAKDSALADDQLDHQVESTEELTPIDDEHPSERRYERKKRRAPADKDPEHPDGENPHLDITA